jgi:hypothetical protein
MSVVVVISQYLLNVFVQLANKRGFKKKNVFVQLANKRGFKKKTGVYRAVA